MTKFVKNSEINNSAKIAFIDQFVNSLELKYDTFVGERGVKLNIRTVIN